MIDIKYKKAFSMITAIFVIVIMATVSSLIMNVTGKTVKATTQQYQKEQAALLARSYTELAILYVMHYDRSSDCLEQINDQFGDVANGYDIRMNISYIGKNSNLVGCGTQIGNLNGTGGFYNTISLVIDTYITYKDFDDPSNRDITFHRRSLQKL